MPILDCKIIILKKITSIKNNKIYNPNTLIRVGSKITGGPKINNFQLFYKVMKDYTDTIHSTTRTDQ